MIPHLDDLDTVWLHLDPTGQVRERRHRARCQPYEQVVAINCTRCEAGPLISGIDPDGELPTAIGQWLEIRGWTLCANLVCDQHT